MDWILAITTVLVNSNLGWSKGRVDAWALHILNSVAWAAYAYNTGQSGIIFLSGMTILFDVVSIVRRKEP